MTSYVEHAQILVTDLSKTAQFYTRLFEDWRIRAHGREIFGAKLYDWMHIGTETSYMAFREHYEGEARREPGAEVLSNHIGIVVDDIEAIVLRLNDMGIDPFRSTHPYRLRAYVRDPDGYELELIQYLTEDNRLRNDCDWCVEQGHSRMFSVTT